MYDNSSLDSLLDAASMGHRNVTNGAESSPAGHSFTNLSQDSGLTTSDSQLYAFEDNNSSASSSDEGERGRGRPQQGQAKRPLIKHLSANTFSSNANYGLTSQTPNPSSSMSFMAMDKMMAGVLRRTASEESVVQKPRESVLEQRAHLVNAARSRRRPAAHRKGRAPAPPSGASIVRSNSVNHVQGNKRSAEWYRSRSTTRLDNERRPSNPANSSSCSTLSDEDSTPLVSRSNSYGRNNPEMDAYNSSGYDIYLRDDHLRRTSNTITTPNASGFTVDTPPGYEETMSRQRLLKNYNRSNSFVITSPSTPSPTTAVKTRLIFEDRITPIVKQSPRMYQEQLQQQQQQPPPLPPKTERPPLPPKQRIRLSIDDTYANSSELRFQTDDNDYQTDISFKQQSVMYPSYSVNATRIQVGRNDQVVIRYVNSN